MHKSQNRAALNNILYLFQWNAHIFINNYLLSHSTFSYMFWPTEVHCQWTEKSKTLPKQISEPSHTIITSIHIIIHHANLLENVTIITTTQYNNNQNLQYANTQHMHVTQQYWLNHASAESNLDHDVYQNFSVDHPLLKHQQSASVKNFN
jgi:hypothetical protein